MGELFALSKKCRAGLILAAILFVPPLPASAEERVTFDSARYLVGSLQLKLARERGEAIARPPAEPIIGYLSKPEGPGPFPAVVVMHGCGGLHNYLRTSAAEQFTGWGYVTLVIDSFATRGVTETCATTVPAYREADAFGALLYLSKLKFVDSKRIALVGHSQGAMATLQVASHHPFDVFEMPTGLTYNAAVTFYPSCNSAEDQLAIPALVMIGDQDDWARAVECKRWMQRRNGRGAPVDLIVFPGAFHDFDIPGERDGRRYFGHWLQYNPEAAARSQTEMHDFLAKELYR